MLTFYVPIDPETKYITAEPVMEIADGLTAVSIAQDDKDTFLANWKYYYVEDGLPVTDNSHILDLAPHHLLHIAQGLQQSLINSNNDLAAAQADAAKAKADAAAASTENAALKTQVTTTQSALLEISDQVLAAMTVTPAADTTSK